MNNVMMVMIFHMMDALNVNINVRYNVLIVIKVFVKNVILMVGCY